MPVATLLTNPAAPALDLSTAEALRRRWNGGPLRWLSPGEAAEFAVPALPQDHAEVWHDLQAEDIDLAIQPDAPRRRRMLIADMDSTMIRQECIDELAEVAGVGDRVREITARAMNGELDFAGALTARVALLSGLDEAVINRVLDERIAFAPGARTLLATMKADGAHTVLVSGGFTAFAGPIAAALGFDVHRANCLEISAGRLTGKVVPPILGRDAKVEALEAEARRHGIDAGEVMAVGDGANDLGMLACAGAGVALHAKPAVAAAADLRINHGDLTALLYLQGYARKAFVAVQN